MAKSKFSQKTVGLKQPLLIAAVTMPFHSEPGERLSLLILFADDGVPFQRVADAIDVTKNASVAGRSSSQDITVRMITPRAVHTHCLESAVSRPGQRMIPGADIAWVDRLDVKTTPQQNATPAQLAVRSETEIPPEEVESSGGPAWIRTKNQQIMSLLL